MSAQSNPQQDSSDENEKTKAVAKKRSGNRRRRDPLMVNRLRQRRAVYQAHHLRRFSYATSASNSSSETERARSGAGAVARSSTGRRLRRRARRSRNAMPAMPARDSIKWIRDMSLDWLECFLVALALLVAAVVILPRVEWELIGPLRLTWHTYGLLACCSLTTIWVLYCLANEMNQD